MQDMTPERIAIHEAGHATMAIMKNVLVTGIRICDTPEEMDGGIAFGVCSHSYVKDWLNSVSISVAGAAAEAAYFGHPSPIFYDGSSSDFMKAL
jgi:ATP-dependent Zn protease